MHDFTSVHLFRVHEKNIGPSVPYLYRRIFMGLRTIETINRKTKVLVVVKV